MGFFGGLEEQFLQTWCPRAPLEPWSSAPAAHSTASNTEASPAPHSGGSRSPPEKAGEPLVLLLPPGVQGPTAKPPEPGKLCTAPPTSSPLPLSYLSTFWAFRASCLTFVGMLHSLLVSIQSPPKAPLGSGKGVHPGGTRKARVEGRAPSEPLVPSRGPWMSAEGTSNLGLEPGSGI